MARPEVRRFLVLIVAALAAVSIGCWDDESITGPREPTDDAPTPSTPLTNTSSGWEVTCDVNVGAGTISCGDEDNQTPQGLSAVIVGGQDQFVTLSNDPPTFDSGTRIFSAEVRVKNLLPQPLGTTDGTTLDPDSIKVFFHDGPIPETVTVNNEDGTGDFTGTNQPYFAYGRIIDQGEETVGKIWEWLIPEGVSSFTFSVYVAAAVPHPNGWVAITPATEGLAVSETQALSAQAFDIVGRAVARTFTWSTSDETIVSVDGSGNVTGESQGGPVTITATATNDPDMSPGTAAVSVGGNDVELQLDAGPDAVGQGDSLFYTLRAINRGPGTVDSLRLRLELSEAVTRLRSGGCIGGTSGSTGNTIFDCPPPAFFGTPAVTGLADGDTATFEVAVADTSPGELTGTLSITDLEPASDPNTSNNTAIESTIVEDLPNADIAITAVADSPDPVFVDDQLTYNVTITNNGPEDAGNVTIDLRVDDNGNADFDSPFPSGCSLLAFGDGDRLFRCDLGPVANGASVTSTDLNIVPHAALVNTTLTATAAVFDVDDAFDPDDTNNTLATTTDVIDDPDLVPSALTFTPSAPFDDETVTVDATITNNSTEGTGVGFDWELRVDGVVERTGSESALAAGASVTINETGLGPFAAGTHGAADHPVELIVDTGDAVAEKDETNNTAVDTLPVQDRGYQITLVYLSTFTQEQQDTIRGAADRWEQIVTGDLSPRIGGIEDGECRITSTLSATTDTTVDDLVIFIRQRSFGGNSALAVGGPCEVRANELPVAGVVEFDSDDIDALVLDGKLDEVAVHEMGHVLGIGTIWDETSDPDVTTDIVLLEGDTIGSVPPHFEGAEATFQYQDAGGSAAGDSVPVEDDLGHWPEVDMDTELMTPTAEGLSTEEPLSKISVGALKDFGYTVDLTSSAIDPYTVPETTNGIRLKGDDSQVIYYDAYLLLPDAVKLPDGRVVPLDQAVFRRE